MPHFVVKADPNEDWYVEWTTITDGPVAYGTRADFLEEEPGWGDRMDRADQTGTSAMMDPPWFSWDTEWFMVAEPLDEQRTLPRKHLRAYTEAIIAADIPTALALTDPIDRDD